MRNRRRNIMSVWVAVIVAMLFFSACSGGRGKVAGNIMPEGLILREGDVVLRCGGGLTSHARGNRGRFGRDEDDCTRCAG